MTAFPKLRQAANRVCGSIERGCEGLFPRPPYEVPRYELEPLEQRRLLSVAAAISGPSEVVQGSGYVLSLTASSTDPSYTVSNWIIDYGDGVTHTLFGDSVADLHHFNTASSPTYDITATVLDVEEGVSYSASTTMDVTVDEATPTLSIYGDEDALAGEAFTAYQGLDDGGMHTLSAFSIAWGDGNSDSDDTLPQTFTDGYADAFSHTYADPGTYNLTATATTEQGSLTMTTAVVAVPLGVGDSGSGYVSGDDYDVTPTFNDPGQTLSSYIVSWGDDSSDSTYAATASVFDHVYADDNGGQGYEATVLAIASDGTWTAGYQASPLAAVWADENPADRGDTVYLDGSFYANDDTPTAWTVDWGDGTTATYSSSDGEDMDGQNDFGGPMDATHVYDSDGTFTITASAADATGSYAADATTVEIDEPTPVFSVMGDDDFTKDQAYAITPSFSISSGDTVDSYVVSWGDGSGEATYDGSSTELSYVYTYGAAAPYTISATAFTDYGSYTNSTSVDEVAPTVSISGPSSVTAGQTATFDTSFDDPNGNTPTAWTVYWGDGDEGESFYGDASSLTHVYTAAPEGGGDWTVAAMVSEEDGQYWADDATVGVSSDTPTLSLTMSATVTAGYQYYLNTSFTDAAGRTPYDWLIDWGDGSGTTFANGGAAELGHTYTLPGSYELEATAVVVSTDPTATANASYSTSVAVEVVDDPNFSFDLYGGGEEGAHAEVDAHFSDPDGATVTSYTVDWGDGHTDEYGQNPNYNGTFEHTYTEASAPGDYTVSVTASTSEGDFSASQTLEVGVNSPWLSVDSAGQADSGQPFLAEAYFAYDTVGNVTTEFPVEGHSVAYTVDWGDGDTNSYDSNVFTHVYNYDYSATPTNYYVFTVTATTDEYSATCYGYVAVDQSGSGELIPGDAPGAVTEGTAATFSGPSFSDDAQTDDGYEGAYLTVWWGDGGSSSQDDTGEEDPAPFNPTHVYAEPGTYQVTYGAGYTEDHDPAGLTGYVVMTDPESVDVAEATPVLSASGSSDSLVVGDQYVMYPTYTDAAGDHRPNVLTVDWGDGQTNVYAGSNPLEPVTHVYTTAGNYDPELSLSAYAAEGGVEGNAPEVDVSPATVSLIAEGDAAAYESGQSAAEFMLTRTGSNDDSPLTVSYTLGGTLDTSAYVVTDENGLILDGSVTIPEGQNYDYVYVTPLEDRTPRWTETADITLTSGSNYTVASDASAAGCYVVNDDLFVWLDNGSDNQILDGGNTTSMTSLVVDLPVETRTGAVVTLTDDADTKANVWMTADPGEDDTPILGDVNGTYVGSISWTYGTSVGAPSGKTTLYVEGTNGSSSLNDISFGVSDDDSNCTTSGDNTDPTLPQGTSYEPTTSESKGSNGTTDMVVQIFSNNDPNPGEPTGIVTNVTRNWLVGQMVELNAAASGPASLIAHLTFQWQIDGSSSAPANVLYSYDPFSTPSTQTPLEDNNGAGALLGNSGLKQQSLIFFWVSTSPSPAMHAVSVIVSGANGSALTKSPPSTFFNVYEPNVSGAAIDTGIPTYSAALGYAGLFAGVVDPHGLTWGEMSTANVSVPAGFNQGTFNFLQLAQGLSTFYAPGLGSKKTTSPPTQIGLDTSFAFNETSLVNILLSKNVSANPFNTIDGWITGASHFFVDSPGTYKMLTAGATDLTEYFIFTDYVMFLAPSAGSPSYWVPLIVGQWQYRIHVETAYNVKEPPLAWAHAGSFATATTEPMWTALESTVYK